MLGDTICQRRLGDLDVFRIEVANFEFGDLLIQSKI